MDLKKNSKTFYSTEGRGMIYDSFIDTIGNTPIVRLSRMMEKYSCKANVLAKLEFFNPLSSIKDRLALVMLENAENKGDLNSDTVIVEPTSGNTGIALAFICARKGYRLVLTMPESMSLERRKMLSLMGAELKLTPASMGMKGAVAEANKFVTENENAIMLQQFENEANPLIHEGTTAREIWNDCEGNVDIFITGVGTGGTLTGCGKFFKSQREDIHIVAVEPEDSPVLSGGSPGPHQIQGIGAGFVPSVLEKDVIDEVAKVSNHDAFNTAREMAKVEGIPVGISSGATVSVALRLAQREENADKNIVLIIASAAERYISTALFD